MMINWPPMLAPIQTLEIRLLSLPMRTRLAASHDREPAGERELVVVRATDVDGFSGWGECSALNSDSYWPETARSSFNRLRTFPFGSPPDDDNSTPMAAAALELAALDLYLKGNDMSLAEFLQVDRDQFVAGAVVGLAPVDEVVAQVGELVDEGYQRVKLKITPGHDVEVVHAVRVRWPDLEIQVDANGSYAPSGLAVMYRIKALGVRIFEQPFDWRAGDVRPIRKLLATGARVVADESVPNEDALSWYHESGAASIVSIKPGRLGGVTASRSMRAQAKELKIAMTLGGMMESGLGRHLLAALGGDRAFTVVGDVSPARRWLAEDPFPDIEMADGMIEVPYTAGVAPAPDEELLEHLTIDRALVPYVDRESDSVRHLH